MHLMHQAVLALSRIVHTHSVQALHSCKAMHAHELPALMLKHTPSGRAAATTGVVTQCFLIRHD